MSCKENNTFATVIENLNPQQLAAVRQTDGPVLVLAGPGTGKTQLLAARIGNILLSTDAQPHNILCLTYTDAGTVAMRQRLQSFIGAESYKIHIHTFHSFCNWVIQENLEYFGIRDLQPISEIESIELFYELIDGFNAAHPLKKYTGEIYSDLSRLKDLFKTMKAEHFSVAYLQEAIDNYVAGLEYRDKYIYKVNGKNYKKGDVKQKELDAEKDCMIKLRAAVAEFDTYQKMMLERKRYDFADMIDWVIKAFEQNDVLLGKYQERFLYTLVDEFQDTNGAQSNLLDLLTSYWESPNLFVVGDDDQAVYGFQGAELKRINQFVETYKTDLTAIILEDNYRSSQLILDAAAAVIRNNQERLIHDDNLKEKLGEISKTLYASNTSIASLPSKVAVREYMNSIHEAAGIVKEIHAAKEEGKNLNDIAIIYRNHKEIEKIIAVFNHLKIPYNTRRRVNILHEPLIKKLLHILSYLQLETERPGGGEFLLFELMHYHFFDIAAKDILTISKEYSRRQDKESNTWRSILSNKEKLFQMGLSSATAISTLERNLAKWQQDLFNETLQVVFEKIINEGNILVSIQVHPNKIWQVEILNSFFHLLKGESIKIPNITLGQFLSTIEKMQKNNLSVDVEKLVHNEDGINLVTAHSSKGLEYKTVYLINAESKSWEKKPGSNFIFKLPDTIEKSSETNKVEEERRLFYVAMTRAKCNLIISYPQMKLKDNAVDNSTLTKSLFVTELLEEIKLETQNITLDEDDIANFVLKTMETSVLDEASIEKNHVAEMMKNFKMSASALNKYLNCPVKFYYENILKIPEARSAFAGFGNAVHYALEKFFSDIKADPEHNVPMVAALLRYFEFGMKRNMGSFTAKDYKLNQEHGIKLLGEYYQEYAQDWGENMILEYRIPLTISDGVPITGAIDKIVMVEKRHHVVDYKTGNPDNGKEKLQRPNDKNPYGGEYWRQMVFYKILLEADKTHQWNMDEGTFDFIRKSKKDNSYLQAKIVINPEEVTLVKQLISEVYHKIKTFQFTEGCNKPDCRWCNFSTTILP